MLPPHRLVFPLFLSALILLALPQLSLAGCGCQKPPPPPSAIRPDATYAGTTVTLFERTLQNGQTYSVTFTSGLTGQTVSVQGIAATKRDLADGRLKPQLRVEVPPLPLGPTSLHVVAIADGSVVSMIDDTAFTIIPAPLALPAQLGESSVTNFQAAVSRDGTVYLSLDVTQVELPMTFQVQAKGYPLRFGNADVVFYNTQGFLMQTLTQTMPGLYTIQAASTSTDSDILRYSRHEFVSYFVQHQERQPHQLDATDPNWHLDGTAHVDHNHLVVAVAAHLSDGSIPPPGATPPFELALTTASLFSQGLVGTQSINMSDFSTTDSFNSQTKQAGTQGSIASNGNITLTKNAVVRGDATAVTFTMRDRASITGTRNILFQPLTFLPVVLPTGLGSLGNVDVRAGQQQLVQGPASYQVANLTVSDTGALVIDNSQGPVTLYVTGNVSLAKNGIITVTDPNPEKFAIYATGNGNVTLSGQSRFYGVVYAPRSVVTLSDQGQFFGSYVGSQMVVDKKAGVHFDSALLGQ